MSRCGYEPGEFQSVDRIILHVRHGDRDRGDAVSCDLCGGWSGIRQTGNPVIEVKNDFLRPGSGIGLDKGDAALDRGDGKGRVSFVVSVLIKITLLFSIL